jgi:hypothetical protein
MTTIQSDYAWDEVFTTKDLSQLEDVKLLAVAQNAWGNVFCHVPLHKNFGEVMVLIRERIGASTPTELDSLYLKWKEGKWPVDRNLHVK